MTDQEKKALDEYFKAVNDGFFWAGVAPDLPLYRALADKARREEQGDKAQQSEVTAENNSTATPE